MKLKKTWEIIALFVALAAIILGVMLGMRAYQHSQASKRAAISSKSPQAQTFAVGTTPSIQPGDRIIGSPDAKLKVFVYEDYTNIFSAELSLTLDKLVKNFGNSVAVVIRPYLKDKSDVWPATALSCASSNDQWVAMRAWLFNRVRSGQLGVPDVSEMAKQLSLNAKSFKACLTNKQKSERIETSGQSSIASEVQGVPTMFIGNQMIIGSRPYDNYVDSDGNTVMGLQALVQRYLEK